MELRLRSLPIRCPLASLYLAGLCQRQPLVIKSSPQQRRFHCVGQMGCLARTHDFIPLLLCMYRRNRSPPLLYSRHLNPTILYLFSLSFSSSTFHQFCSNPLFLWANSALLSINLDVSSGLR